MQERVEALLALLSTHTGQRAALVRALLETRDPSLLARSPQWRPPARAWPIAMRQRVALQALGIDCLICYDFPALLARARPLPPVLFVRGNRDRLARPAVSIVGARRASLGPRAWAAQVAAEAVGAGLAVVSGGAVGIDSVAHHAALAHGGCTIVYLGVAADRIYPMMHRRLFERVLEHDGVIVSEHPPFATTFGASHSARNRFIAAQASHLFIAEAAAKSGTLTTATYARRLRVPIWVPGPEVGGERGGIDELLGAGGAQTLAANTDLAAQLAQATKTQSQQTLL